MALVKDIEIDPTTCDIVISGGDLSVKESDQQHVEHIIRADKGHFRQFPLVGIGIDRFIKGPFNIQEVKQLIKLQLKADNYDVRQVIVTSDGKISIDAERIF